MSVEKGSGFRDGTSRMIRGDASAERDAEDAAALFDMVMGPRPGGAWRRDRDGTLHLSPGACALYGLPSSQERLDVEGWKARIVPQDREWAGAALDALLEGRRERFDIEVRLLGEDGETLRIRSQGLRRDRPGGGCALIGFDREVPAPRGLEPPQLQPDPICGSEGTGIAIGDLDGRIVKSNPAFARLLGYTPEELAGVDFTTLVHPADRDENLKLFRRLVRSAAPLLEVENRYLHKNGKPVWVHKMVTTMPDAEGRPSHFVILVADMTARRMAEAALRLERDTQRAIVENISTGICIADQSGRVLSMNAEAMRIHGLPPGAPLPERLGARNPLYTFHDSAGRPLADEECPLARAIGGETVRDQLLTLVAHDSGVNRFVNVTVQPIRDDNGESRFHVCTLNDLTALKRTELSLRRSEERLRLAAKAARFGTFDADLVTGRAQWSAETRRMLGFAPDAPAPSVEELRTLIHPEDAGVAQEVLVAAMDPAGGGRFRRSCRLICPDGRTRWIEFIGQVTFTRQAGRRRPARLTGMLTDISERRRMEDALANAQRVEAIGQMAGGITHDFNNLLAIIAGKLELAEPRVADKKARDLIRGAVNAVRVGAAINRRILSATRKDRLMPEETDLNAAVEGAERLLKHVLGEDIALECDLAPDLWPVLADLGELDSALLNLAGNARDAMPEGGSLRITTANLSLDEREAGRDGTDYVSLSFRDTGVGMSTEVARQAMDPYFTTKPRGKGTGLGLTGIRLFVERSGGFVTLDSAPGRGTTVTLNFPRAATAKHAPRPRRLAPEEAAEPGHGELVLVVEDDDALRETVVERLEMLGYAAIEAPDAHAAISALQAGEPVDLVFSDLVMPGGMSGRDLARWLNEHKPGVPVLLTSGYFGPPEDADDLPDLPLLRKPYTLVALAAALRRALGPADQGAGRVRPAKT